MGKTRLFLAVLLLTCSFTAQSITDSIEYYSYIDTVKCSELIYKKIKNADEAKFVYNLYLVNYYAPRKNIVALKNKIVVLSRASDDIKKGYIEKYQLKYLWYLSLSNDKNLLTFFKQIINNKNYSLQTKIHSMNLLSYRYAFENTIFASNLLTTAIQLGLKDSLPELYHSYYNYSTLNVNFNINDAKLSLEKGLKFKKKNNNPILDKLYIQNKAVFYFLENNIDSALLYFMNGMLFFKKYDFPEHIVGSTMNVSRMYFIKNKFDSANVLLFNIYDYVEKKQNMLSANFLSRYYWTVSEIYAKRKQMDSAIFFIRKSLDVSLANQIYDAIPEQYFDLAEYLQEMSQIDSAFAYLKLAYRKKVELEQQIKQPKDAENSSRIKFLENSLKLKEYEFKLIKSQKEIKSLTTNLYLITFFVILLAFLTISIVRNRYLIKITKMKDKFSQELINQQEHIIQTFSNELHDNIGQQLLLINHNSLIQTNEQLKKQLNALINDVRETSHRFFPKFLLNISFSEAIKNLIYLTEQNSSFTIIADIESTSNEISASKQLHLYRICQELVTNTLKYCDGRLIKIKLVKKDRYFYLCYDDKSEKEKNKKIKKGFGLNSIEIRAKMLDGNVEYYYNYGFHLKLTFNP